MTILLSALLTLPRSEVRTILGRDYFIAQHGQGGIIAPVDGIGKPYFTNSREAYETYLAFAERVNAAAEAGEVESQSTPCTEHDPDAIYPLRFE